jgi:broad specificity phosphatase PhoE
LYEGETVVAVSHSGVILVSFLVLGGVLPRPPFCRNPLNASITEWVGTRGRADQWQWRLVRYNDAGPC